MTGILHSRFLVCAAALLAGATITGTHANTYYVATNGNDSTHDGLSTNTPLATIQKAESLTGPGDNIYVRGGIYREQVWVTNYGQPANLIHYLAYPGETPVIKATDIATNWTHYTNSVWKSPGLFPEPQQVIDDGTLLTQIGKQRFIPPELCTTHGTNINDMFPGSFYYDRDNTNLYVWLEDESSPNNSEMEASARVFTFFMGHSNVTSHLHIKGLTFMYGNSCTVTSGWPTVLTGGGSIIEDSNILYGDFAGLALGPTSQAHRCNVIGNGDLGISAQDSYLISHCVITSNNYREFSSSGVAGGIKIIPDFHGRIENSEVAWNLGPGIWIDSCRSGKQTTICSNYVHNNLHHGIFVEISVNVEVKNNLVAENEWSNLYIASSEQTSIHNNTIVNQPNWVAAQMYYHAARTNHLGIVYALRSNDFVNNILYHNNGIADLVMVAPDGSNVANNSSDYNCYLRTNSESSCRFAVNPIDGQGIAYTNLSQWINDTGWDNHSVAMDPLFVNATVGDFHLRSSAGTFSNGSWHSFSETSPAIDKGDPTYSYTNETPWNGGRVNAGRYGNTPEASRSPDTDGDGLSDPLEQTELHTDPALPDTDGDTADDFQEYISGSNPTNSSSQFIIRTNRSSPTNANPLKLTWFGVSGRVYTVYSRSNLSTNSWSEHHDLTTDDGIPVGALAGSNEWISVIDTNRLDTPSRFYMMKAHWP